MGNSLNCIEKCRMRDEDVDDEIVEYLQKGANFRMKKTTFGIVTRYDDIHLFLSSDKENLAWTSKHSHNEPNLIKVLDIGAIQSNGKSGIRILSTNGDVLIDVECEEECVRTEWITNLKILCHDESDEDDASSSERTSSLRGAIKAKREQQAYWRQKAEDLANRKKEADDRKKKLGEVGFKYTAIAMSNRTSKGGSDS